VGGGVLKHGEQNIKHRKPSEGAADIALAGAAFGVESKLLSACEPLEVPAFKGKWSAYLTVLGVVEVHEPLHDREGTPRCCQHRRMRGLETESNAFFVSQEHP